MKNELKYLVGFFLFLIAVFNLFRIFFIYFNAFDSDDSLWSFYYGAGLDISVASYCLLFPIFILMIHPYVRQVDRNKNRILYIYSIVIFTLISLIEIASIPLFKEWGTTLNSRGLGYLKFINEAWISSGNSDNFLYYGLFFIILLTGIRALKYLHVLLPPAPPDSKRRNLIFLATSVLLFVGLRGGIQGLPIDVSSAFYSKNQPSNFASVNKAFYLFHDLDKKRMYGSVENKFSDTQLDSFYCALFQNNHTTDTFDILKSKTPNIVLVLLEGWPFKIVDSLMACTPNFIKLEKEGLFFDHIYSSGFRTDQGLLSILSGVPALYDLNIMSDISLVEGFPSIIQSYNKNGYNTSFFYGGSLDFSNLKNYFYYNETAKIVGKADFPGSDRSLDWGVPDHIVFKRAICEFNQINQPFFSCILTLSSHPPFDTPEEKKNSSKTIEERFKSSVIYLDKSINSFIEQSKKTSWFDNTLFVFVADHGSMYLESIKINDHERFHIPLLIYGEPLKEEYRGKTFHNIGNHHDIPASLLALSGIENNQFPFSQNILQKREPAFWVKEITMGWLTEKNSLILNHEKEDYFYKLKYARDEKSKSDALKYLNLVTSYVLKKKELEPIGNCD